MSVTAELPATLSKPIRTDEHARAYLAEFHPEALARFEDGATSYTYRVTETCGRCGGAGYYPTPYHGACYDCGGNPRTYVRTVTVKLKALAQRLAREDRKAARARAKAEDAAREAEANRAAFLAQHEGLEAILATEGVAILASFREQLASRGSLTERQVEVARSIAAQRSADDAAHVPAPEGRVTFTGEIVSAKPPEAGFGSRTRITVRVRTGDGGLWIANGNAPAALERLAIKAGKAEVEAYRVHVESETAELRETAKEDDAAHEEYRRRMAAAGEERVRLQQRGSDELMKGRTVTLTATLTRGRDAHFALFRRPTNVKLSCVESEEEEA